MLDFKNQLSKIALGTVQFGMNYGISNSTGITETNEVRKILAFCRKNHIDTLDTAYGYGDSEKVLGNFDLSCFKVISKFLDYETSGLKLSEQFEISLKNMKLKKIYGYLAHRPMEVSYGDWKTLLELKEGKKILKIGFSFNLIQEIDLVLRKGFIPDLVQVPFNYLDSRFEDKLKFLKETYNTEIHTRSTFLQGLFFLKPNELSSFFDPIKEALLKIEKIDNKAGALLKYALVQPFVDKVVIGVNLKLQLEQNIEELKQADLIKKNSDEVYPNECLIPSKWPK